MNYLSRLGFSLLLAAYPTINQAAEFDAKDESSLKLLFGATPKVERLATGMRFVEGPVWVARDGGYLVFSDIPANELKRWTPTGGVALLRYPSHNANGNTVDSKGRLVTAEHSGRRISFTTKKENVKPLVSDYNGKRFNSPNDVVVKGDGTVWFTDPDYGLPKGETRELDGNFVFRCDDKGKSLEVVAKDFDKPNGLCFSPDERRLYIADSGKPHHIRVFDVREDGSLANGRVFCVIDPGAPDGIRCDRDGRVWSSAGNGVQVFSPQGDLLARINLPESAANLCFGGDDGTTLFVTARTSLYAVKTRVTGAPRPERESKK